MGSFLEVCRNGIGTCDVKKEEAFIEAGFKLVKVIEDSAESYFTMNVYEN